MIPWDPAGEDTDERSAYSTNPVHNCVVMNVAFKDGAHVDICTRACRQHGEDTRGWLARAGPVPPADRERLPDQHQSGMDVHAGTPCRLTGSALGDVKVARSRRMSPSRFSSAAYCLPVRLPASLSMSWMDSSRARRQWSLVSVLVPSRCTHQSSR